MLGLESLAISSSAGEALGWSGMKACSDMLLL